MADLMNSELRGHPGFSREMEPAAHPWFADKNEAAGTADASRADHEALFFRGDAK